MTLFIPATVDMASRLAETSSRALDVRLECLTCTTVSLWHIPRPTYPDLSWITVSYNLECQHSMLQPGMSFYPQTWNVSIRLDVASRPRQSHRRVIDGSPASCSSDRQRCVQRGEGTPVAAVTSDIGSSSNGGKHGQRQQQRQWQQRQQQWWWQPQLGTYCILVQAMYHAPLPLRSWVPGVSMGDDGLGS